MFGKPPAMKVFVEKRTASVVAQVAGTSKGFVPNGWIRAVPHAADRPPHGRADDGSPRYGSGREALAGRVAGNHKEAIRRVSEG